jgi:hypothetical protein
MGAVQAVNSVEEGAVAVSLDQLPSAKDMQVKLAQAEAAEASKEMARRAALEAEQRKLLESLEGPSGVSDEEGIRRAIAMIERAVGNRLTEIQVYRFPNKLCTDHGRAINQQEVGWEQTLTGIPREIYGLWDRHFRERGYKLRAEIVNFPNGVPGDVGLFLKWS